MIKIPSLSFTPSITLNANHLVDATFSEVSGLARILSDDRPIKTIIHDITQDSKPIEEKAISIFSVLSFSFLFKTLKGIKERIIGANIEPFVTIYNEHYSKGFIVGKFIYLL